MQQADGYDATIVSGVVTHEAAKATGVRGAQGTQPQFGAAAS